MPNFWQISNRSAAGAAATATQAAPTNAGSSGLQLRLRALQATLSGASSGTDQLVVRDGASGVGTIIYTEDVAIAANATVVVQLDTIDIRATAGNALTVEFVNGVAGDRENVNAQGDYVSIGLPWSWNYGT